MFGILKDLNHHKRDGAIPGKFHFYEKEKKNDGKVVRWFRAYTFFYYKQHFF